VGKALRLFVISSVHHVGDTGGEGLDVIHEIITPMAVVAVHIVGEIF
jgi:hypothetical protein